MKNSMITMPLLRMFLRELRNQRKRMTLTVFALVWGTFSIILLLSFGDGLRLQMQKANAGLGKAIVMVFGGQTSKPYMGLGKGRPIFLIEDDVELLKNRIPEIEFISPENERQANTVTYGRNSFSRSVIGIYPAFGEMRAYYPTAGGRFLNALDLEKSGGSFSLAPRPRRRYSDRRRLSGRRSLSTTSLSSSSASCRKRSRAACTTVLTMTKWPFLSQLMKPSSERSIWGG
jgi:hypothetical protein